MKFKVGDKVKVIQQGTNHTGRIGVIYEVRGPEMVFRYAAFFGSRSDWMPYRPDEIKRVPIKGEQLLFSFMKQ